MTASAGRLGAGRNSLVTIRRTGARWTSAESGRTSVTTAEGTTAPAERDGPVVVQKYGGTSVATAERILAIADRIERNLDRTPRLVVVLSAMGSTTDELVGLAHQVSDRPAGREMDLLLSTGEQVTVSLLGLALQNRDIPAVSLTALQCGIRTDGVFNVARIRQHRHRPDPRRARRRPGGHRHRLPGHQRRRRRHHPRARGQRHHRGGPRRRPPGPARVRSAPTWTACSRPTRRGCPARGCGRRSATRRPSRWPRAAPRSCIRAPPKCAWSTTCRSTCAAASHLREGTWIRGAASIMERAEVVAVTGDAKIAKFTLLDVPDEPGMAARVFQDLAAGGINVRLIIQSASSAHQGPHHVHPRQGVRGGGAGARPELGGRRGDPHLRRRGRRRQDLHRGFEARLDPGARGADVRGPRGGGASTSTASARRR